MYRTAITTELDRQHSIIRVKAVALDEKGMVAYIIYNRFFYNINQLKSYDFGAYLKILCASNKNFKEKEMIDIRALKEQFETMQKRF